MVVVVVDVDVVVDVVVDVEVAVFVLVALLLSVVVVGFNPEGDEFGERVENVAKRQQQHKWRDHL